MKLSAKLSAAFFAAVLALLPMVGQALEPLATPAPDADTVAPAGSALHPETLERELQSLDWKQFRQVVESSAKLKADVDAYGPLGWQYVRKHYQSYGWRKSVRKLDEAQRQRLADSIAEAKGVPAQAASGE